MEAVIIGLAALGLGCIVLGGIRLFLYCSRMHKLVARRPKWPKQPPN